MKCKKCKVHLVLHRPTPQLTHCGTDFWTKYGERLWKPTVCAACKSKNGKHAKAVQDEQIRKAMYNVTKQAFSSSGFQS